MSLSRNIQIFEDGKLSRGIDAKLVKRRNKAVLIEFLYYDFETDKDILITEWFTLWTGIENKERDKDFYPKYTNKRKKACYIHKATNYFYDG